MTTEEELITRQRITLLERELSLQQEQLSQFTQQVKMLLFSQCRDEGMVHAVERSQDCQTH